MGSYNWTEICELVGLCILHVLGEKYGTDKIGLYRNDGLACFRNISGSQAEWIRKEFTSIFKSEFKLSITSETNLKIVNFLDITLNLNTGTNETYNKTNNKVVCFCALWDTFLSLSPHPLPTPSPHTLPPPPPLEKKITPIFSIFSNY